MAEWMLTDEKQAINRQINSRRRIAFLTTNPKFLLHNTISTHELMGKDVKNFRFDV